LASPDPKDPGRTLTGWVALVGALMALTCTASYFAVVGGDLRAMSRPTFALGLSPAGQALFRLSQTADCLGYYLPFLAIGAYLRARLRPSGGVEVAAPFIVVSAALGIAGSGLQLAALPALAATHASRDPAVQHAAESAWLAVVEGSQNGLWLMEGPSLGFWATVTGLALRRQGGAGLGLFLAAIGVAYVAYAGLALFGGHELAKWLEVVILPAQVAWEALFGIALLSRRPLVRALYHNDVAIN
jgi:hypothetical protein